MNAWRFIAQGFALPFRLLPYFVTWVAGTVYFAAAAGWDTARKDRM